MEHFAGRSTIIDPTQDFEVRPSTSRENAPAAAFTFDDESNAHASHHVTSTISQVIDLTNDLGSNRIDRSSQNDLIKERVRETIRLLNSFQDNPECIPIIYNGLDGKIKHFLNGCIKF